MSGKHWPYLLPIIAIILLVVIFGKRLLDVEQGADPHLLPSVLLNTPAPSFSLAALPGRASDTTAPFTTADLKGQVSLLNVWGSWCIACLEEHPNLVAIAKQEGVVIQGIDWRDTPERGAAWLRDHGDPYAHVGQDPDSATAIDLGVTGAPETFVVDAAGIIRYKQIGPITPEVWHDTLQPLIANLQKQAQK
jgi:cytochrome c biogenesis protein CcmG/thiol:disulfide interchange protein DsbE